MKRSARRLANNKLSPAVLRELRELLPPDTTKAGADALLCAADYAAQFVFTTMREPEAARRRQLREVERRCHALLIALRGLSEDATGDLETIASDLIHGTGGPAVSDALAADLAAAWGDKPRLTDDRIPIFKMGLAGPILAARLSALRGSLPDVEALAAAAAERLAPGRQDRPALIAARRATFYVATIHQRKLGTRPPIGNGWFQAFMQTLGDAAGANCGPRLVNSILRTMPK